MVVSGLVVWVNGPFGGGKTTLVEELAERWPQALVYDPELVGFAVREIVPVPTGDFQDLVVWRQSVVDLALRLLAAYERPLLVPMTLVDADYLREIHDALQSAGVELRHFFLKVSAEELATRIDAQAFTPDDPERDARVRVWRKEQIARCVAAARGLPADTVLLDGELPTRVLADRVLEEVKVAPRA
ncbi:AAA family ATPase [Streptantibioticus parmotrematis]|uniref:AAA family ATPase n=1 Tax=Streptantibioticus parmotrematis TaxID=2873249 RepID=UPI003556436D